MAVVDEEKVEKVEAAGEDKPERASEGRPGGLAGVLGWPGRKLAEGRAFFSEVRSELKKVTWPSRKEVYSTTIVVIATSILFGFYLWGLDLAFSRAMSLVLAR
ncbi:MAG TPA: preprotein translocase subunit SecE [Vicinamibacteria bacterium]|jgi:preprotein translocase subunit SecE